MEPSFSDNTRSVVETLLRGSCLAELTETLRTIRPTDKKLCMEQCCKALKITHVGEFLQYQIIQDLVEPRNSIFRGQPLEPLQISLMERHPLSSQAFVPVDGQRYIVVVAPAGDAPKPESLRAFVATGDQGINYRRGVWHHPMIALDRVCEFVEVHRAGPETNCDEVAIDAAMAGADATSSEPSGMASSTRVRGEMKRTSSRSSRMGPARQAKIATAFAADLSVY